MRHPGHRDVHRHVEVLSEHVVLGHADVVQDLLQLFVEALGLLVVCCRVGQVHGALAVERDPVLGPGEVLGGQPEVHGVGGDVGQAPVRCQQREVGLLPLHGLRVGLADHLDVAQRIVEVRAAEVEVVQPERLLEGGLVGFLAQRHDRFEIWRLVIPPDLIRAVGQPARMGVTRRRQQQPGLVGGPGRDHHDVGLEDLLGAPVLGDRRRSPNGRRRRSAGASPRGPPAA